MTVGISRDEMRLWTRYVHEITGISLDESKGYLLETRLREMLADSASRNFSELLSKVTRDPTHAMRKRVIESITTNETSFFRDNAPFELLRNKLVPDLIDRRTRSGTLRNPIRIWSAACSTGQEAYSVAMVLKELLGELTRYDIRIFGTDISNAAVARASYGEFSKLELDRGLSPAMLDRHFVSVNGRWRVRDELRALLTFRTMNLLEPCVLPAPFDIILCRNVAIYFSELDRIQLYRNLEKAMGKDACLMVGATESLGNLCPELEPKHYLRAVFYQRRSIQ